MPSCPSCGERIGLGQMLGGDLRHLSCRHCPAILAVKTRMGLLPALLLIFLGPPTAKAVQEGWFSVPTAIAGGLALLLAAGWLGYATSSTSVLRQRHQAG